MLFDGGSPVLTNTFSISGTNGRAIENSLILTIGTASTTLFCSFQDINLQPVLDALFLARLRGVDVRVGLDDDNRGLGGYRILGQYLPATGENRKLWSGNAGAGVDYLNLCVADETTAWISTAAPTMQGIYSQTAYSAYIQSDRDGIARKFTVEMDLITHGSFGAAKQRLNRRNFYLVGDASVGVFFAPEEDPLKSYIIPRIAEARKIRLFSSEFFSNKVDSNKCRIATDLAYEILNSRATFKQSITGWSSEVGASSSVIGKDPDANCPSTTDPTVTSGLWLRNRGIASPVMPGDWSANGLNFMIIDSNNARPTVLVSSHPYNAKADSSHDGIMMIVDHPGLVSQFTQFYDALLARSFVSASTGGDDMPADNGMEVVISEINWMGGYKNDLSTSPYEYVELYNNSGQALNLSGWKFECRTSGSYGTIFTLPTKTMIGPGQYMVFTHNSASATVVGQPHLKFTWGGTGSNVINNTSTDQCRLMDINGTVVDYAGAISQNFSSNNAFFGLSDSTAKIIRSMERIDLRTSGATGTNWHTNSNSYFLTNYNIGKDFADRTFGTPGLPNSAAGVREFNVIFARATVATTVEVTFSEPPDSAASTTGNYQITTAAGSCSAPVLNVTGGVTLAGNVATITTDPQTAGIQYKVCVSNVRSAAQNSPMVISTANFYGFAIPCAFPNVKITEFHAAPSTTLSDPNFDGTLNTTQDEFVEIKNTGAVCDLSGQVITDSTSVRHTFPAGTVLNTNQRMVIYGGGTAPTISGSVFDVSSSGNLGLSNGATDAVKLCTTSAGCASTTCSGAAPEIDCASYPPLADPDSDTNRNSYARASETGAFAFHDTLFASERASPGRAPGAMVPFVYQYSGSATSPKNQGTSFPGTSIKIQFSVGMDTSTLTNTNIKLFQDTADICANGEISLTNATFSTKTITNDTVSFTPSTTLDVSETFCVRVTTGVKGIAGTGTPLLTDAVYEFTTVPSINLKINEIGNQMGGTVANDFIELVNMTSSPVDLLAADYYIQRDSSCNLSNGVSEKIALTGTIPANGYYIISRIGNTLSNVNQTDLGSLGGGDCVVLTQGNTSVTAAGDSHVIDWVATVGATDTENGLVAPTIAASNTAVSRIPDGTDTNSNAADFQTKTATVGLLNGLPGFSSSPVDGATSVVKTANVVLTFTESMNTGFGTVNVVGTSSGAQNGLTCVWDTVTFANDRCTINPADFTDNGESVGVTLNSFISTLGIAPSTNSFSFTVVNAATAPTVTNVVVTGTSPNNGTTPYNTGTATVTITGTNFTGATVVKVNNLTATNATTFTVDSGTTITATFPAGIRTNGATGWDVQITNPSGTNATSTVKFIPVAGLLITEVGDTYGANANNDYVEIYNPTAASVSMSGYYLGRDSSCGLSGGWTQFTALPASSVASHGYFLVSRASNTISADSTILTAMATNACVALAFSSTQPTTAAANNVIDFVGFGTVTDTENGVAAATFAAGQSTQRGGACKGTDTDANNVNFSTNVAPAAPNNSGTAACP